MRKHLAFGVGLSLVAATVHSESTNAQTHPMPKPHAANAVFLSHPNHTFEFQFSALFLQPTGSNLDYAAETIALPAPSPDWKIYEIHTDYHFGFDLGLRNIFHGSNSSLTLDWEHFHSRDTGSKRVSSSNMIGPFFEIGPDASPYKEAHGKVHFYFDQVDLNYGIFVNFGNRLQTNLFSGISFARIKQTLYSRYSNLSGSILRTIQVPSTFKGAGPQLGFDFCYRIVKGFHFTGGASASLLVGPQKNHTTFNAYSPALAGLGISPPNKQKTKVHEKTQVVPGLEGKLGLSYLFTFCKHFMIQLEAGYQAQVYIDAIQTTDIGSEVVAPPVTPDTIGVYARTFQQNLSNFALAGPYVMIDFGF